MRALPNSRSSFIFAFVLAFAPFLLSAPIYIFVAWFVPDEVLIKTAEMTQPVSHFSGMYRAYLITGDARYLAYWLDTLLSLPLAAILLVWAYFSRKHFASSRETRTNRLSRKTVVIGLTFGFLIAATCYGISSVYFDKHSTVFFSPDAFGAFNFAVAFQGFYFFTVLLILLIILKWAGIR